MHRKDKQRAPPSGGSYLALALTDVDYLAGVFLISFVDPVECIGNGNLKGKGATMGIKDLEGKRTGRPRGAKTTSRVRRDILWAYRNLGNPDAKPPSPGAKLWADLARQQPGQFLACLVRFETAEGQDLASEGEGAGPGREMDGTGGATGNGWGGKPPQRVRKLFVDADHLITRLTSDGSAWVSNLPRGAYVVGGETDPSRDGIVFTIHSDTFPPVAEGEPIPEISPVFSREP
jgi:hypothetical protein